MYVSSRELPGAPSVAEAIFPSAAVASPAPAAARLPAPCAILLAVSDAPLRAFARQALEGAGCSVVEADSGSEAREIAAGPGAGIDILVADLALMAQSGAELRGAAAGELPATQTIVLVGLHDVPQASLASRGARTVLLAVPFRPDELLALVWTLTAEGPASKPGTA
jgi:DNA-binding NtrC family response regulator